MDIQEKTGTTFVIVTHDQEEAMTVASRVAVMDLGKIVQVATPAEIYEAPNSTYVADFIGEVTLLRGTATARVVEEDPVDAEPEEPAISEPPKEQERVAKPNAMGEWLHDRILAPFIGKRIEAVKALPPPSVEELENTPAEETEHPIVIPEGGLEIAWSDTQAPLIATNGDTELDGKDVALALRPEKLRISKSKPDAANRYEGKVIDIAYLGNISTFHVELSGGVMVKVQTVNAERVTQSDITWEDQVWVSFDTDAGVVLDR